MKKTLLSVSLAAGLLFTSGNGASAATVHYKDVNPKFNYYPAVENLLKQKAVSRTLENFRPNENVTRGQAASIIVKVLGLDISNVKDPKFTDVPKSNQFYPYIAALQNEGIIGGKGDGRYGINEPLTRGQMAAILVDGFDIPLIGIHAVGHEGFSDTVHYAGGPGENSITDGDIFGMFYGQFAQAIETMKYYGYISGYTTTNNGWTYTEFKRNNPIKRSQLALMIYNIQKGTDYEYLYFKDFNIVNNTTSNYTKYKTDEVKVKDSSVVTFIDVSNSREAGLLDGGDEKIVIENEYAILELKKAGTTTISFENNETVVEVTVTEVNGELTASFKDVTEKVSSTPLTPLTPATPIDQDPIEEENTETPIEEDPIEEETTETPIDENGREVVASEENEDEVIEENEDENVSEEEEHTSDVEDVVDEVTTENGR